MTRSRRGRGGHGGGGGGGGGHGGGDSRWLVTYADLLTLLMVLFLVLWVISTIDLKKFEQFKGGLGDFGNPSAQKYNAKNVDTGKTNDTTTTTTTIAAGETTTTTSVPSTDPAASTTTVIGGLGPGNGPKPLTATQLVGELTTLKGEVTKAALDNVVDVHIDERGLVVSVSTDNVLFASGSGALTPAGAQIIGSVAPDIAALGNKIIVEGYTDNRPLHRTGYDNWDLSVDRAVSVLKVLRDGFNVAPARLAATGYGDQQPIATGNDAASLAKNRRVEIVLVAGPAT